MDGKAKCKILKEIRKQIAEDNDIPYIVQECRYQGKCSGTCPKCEEELRYLEAELAKRKKTKIAIAAGGTAAALLLAGAGAIEFLDEVFDKVNQPTSGVLALSSQVELFDSQE